MERTSLARPRVQPAPRAARKSEWLRSALAHYHRPDPGAENEIVVLATGVDQYLQEVFHHLAYPNRDDTVSAEDFSVLCAVMGLTGAERDKNGGEEERGEAEDDEFRDVCSGLPCQLTFKDFHSRLCEYFRVRSARRGTGESAWRLPVTEDTELVERQIRLRWPHVRRRKCVSFDLTKEKSGSGNRSGKGRAQVEARGPDEAAALRELVEDLRSALQGSDARCMALEVALRREKSSAAPPPPHLSTTASPTKSSITLVQGKLMPTQRLKGQRSGCAGDGARRAARRRDIRDPVLRELRLIRAGRDGQLEEAIRFNQRLEEELQWAYQAVRRLQGVESALRTENNHIRRRAEEAREALSLGLQRVRMIQEQAQSVPQLRSRISQLDRELQRYRSCCSCVVASAGQQSTTEEDQCSKDADCLQRAVEGKAASDEEEEERGVREGGECCLTEVKRLSGCGKGCQSHKVPHVLSQNHTHGKTSSSKDSRGRCSCKLKLPPGGDKGFERRGEEEEGRTKLQGHTRGSVVEDKLAQSLRPLMQLRSRKASRSVLAQLVMDTLDVVCSRDGDGPCQVLQVAEALTARLTSGELLAERGPDDGRGGGEEGGGGAESGEKLLISPSGRPTSSISSLLISC